MKMPNKEAMVEVLVAVGSFVAMMAFLYFLFESELPQVVK